jgi:hypothetical protein
VKGRFWQGIFEAIRERLPQGEAPVLVLRDTTEFSYKREDMAAVGLVSKGSVRKDAHGRPVYFTTCGINQHSSLAVTPEGLPLGLTAAKFWSRKAFKGRAARRKAHNAPIEEKESVRWLENLRSSTELLAQPQRCVHVGDQESDIFDLFGAARQLGTHFFGAHARRPAGRWRTRDRSRGHRPRPSPRLVSHCRAQSQGRAV